MFFPNSQYQCPNLDLPQWHPLIYSLISYSGLVLALFLPSKFHLLKNLQRLWHHSLKPHFSSDHSALACRPQCLGKQFCSTHEGALLVCLGQNQQLYLNILPEHPTHTEAEHPEHQSLRCEKLQNWQLSEGTVPDFGPFGTSHFQIRDAEMVKSIQISTKPETSIVPLLESLCTTQHYKAVCTRVCLLVFSPHSLDCALPMSTEYQAQSPHLCQTNEQKAHTNTPCKMIKPNIHISVLEVRTQMHWEVTPVVGSGGRPCLLIPRHSQQLTLPRVTVRNLTAH